jgi:hypothetical protein
VICVCAASRAGDEVSDAFLSPRILESIVQVPWLVSFRVMEKHSLTIGGAPTLQLRRKDFVAPLVDEWR